MSKETSRSRGSSTSARWPSRRRRRRRSLRVAEVLSSLGLVAHAQGDLEAARETHSFGRRRCLEEKAPKLARRGHEPEPPRPRGPVSQGKPALAVRRFEQAWLHRPRAVALDRGRRGTAGVRSHSTTTSGAGSSRRRLPSGSRTQPSARWSRRGRRRCWSSSSRRGAGVAARADGRGAGLGATRARSRTSRGETFSPMLARASRSTSRSSRTSWRSSHEDRGGRGREEGPARGGARTENEEALGGVHAGPSSRRRTDWQTLRSGGAGARRGRHLGGGGPRALMPERSVFVAFSVGEDRAARLPCRRLTRRSPSRPTRRRWVRRKSLRASSASCATSSGACARPIPRRDRRETTGRHVRLKAKPARKLFRRLSSPRRCARQCSVSGAPDHLARRPALVAAVRGARHQRPRQAGSGWVSTGRSPTRRH